MAPPAWSAGFSRHSPPEAGGGKDLICGDGAKAGNAGFSRHSLPEAGGGKDLICRDGTKAWNAGLQTGTRCAKRSGLHDADPRKGVRLSVHHGKQQHDIRGPAGRCAG